MICFKVDQYYYGAKPDVQRAGVQVWKRNENETNRSKNSQTKTSDVDKKKLLYFAVNKISTKAFAVYNWVCGQGVGERPNQEVHPGHTIKLSPNKNHILVTSSSHQTNIWLSRNQHDHTIRLKLASSGVGGRRRTNLWEIWLVPLFRLSLLFMLCSIFLMFCFCRYTKYDPFDHSLKKRTFLQSSQFSRPDSLSSQAVVGVWTMRWSRHFRI